MGPAQRSKNASRSREGSFQTIQIPIGRGVVDSMQAIDAA
jgi:hypothetical protein